MSNSTEMQKMFSLLVHINDHYAAAADAQPDWPHRTLVITVDESGKTVYAATLAIDSPAIEANCRLVRHELEQMIEDCELPILHMEVAA